MKEAIGGSWLLLIVILFVILFAGFMSLSINWSKCYKVKDNIIFLIEKHHGMNTGTLSEINEYLSDVGYRSVGECPKDGNCWYPFNYANTNRSSTPANFCVRKHMVSATALGHPVKAYYTVRVFFRLDLPVISQLVRLNIDGETGVISAVSDDLIKKISC